MSVVVAVLDRDYQQLFEAVRLAKALVEVGCNPGDGDDCIYCGGERNCRREVEHKEDCVWLKAASALLAIQL